MKVLITVLSFNLILCSFAQDLKVITDSSRLVQLSGVVISETDLNPLPYTTVYDRSIKKGVVSDYYGFFSTVVLPGDTLLFSGFGYKLSTYIVPDTLKDNRYSIIHMLQKDTTNLKMVTVYPWPSREDFARAFVDMEPYDDAIRRAQRELSGEALAFVAAKLDNDASLAYGYSINQRYTKLYTNGQLPVNNLLNPYSWAKLIQDWKAGKLSRQ
ncbi:MAG: carboxypeptidase-like regulatory domain-containing protein [Cryomorphaceae bacterium]|nr:carboxypeptidase-like regulatory domain-containing protein [Cryomorphaceae bacterium]